MEALAIDLETLLELTHRRFVYYDYPSVKDRAADHRLPSWFIKECAYGILNGLDFLHRQLRLIYAGESTLLAGVAVPADIASRFAPLGLKPCNIAFRLSNMEHLTRQAVDHEQGEQDDEPWSNRTELHAKGKREDFDYRSRRPILGPLGLSKSSLRVFCEMATIVLTDFGRCGC